jgi:uncharacterized protein
MGRDVDRREFLKAARTVAGAAAYTAALPTAAFQPSSLPAFQARPVRISSQPYTPVDDYPIQAKPGFDVLLKDRFWKPKVTTNAEVTIPFEVQKLTEGGRALTGNVLEAAMLSLKTHPDPALQDVVDASVQTMVTRPARGNGDFEAAATYYLTTGKRDLVDRAVKTADALYDDFVQRDPPFSGGERDAINCVQLYRATHEKKYLDLAKHYLDIRGLENSVNRSRHNQSYKPVLEQSEAVGHAVNCVSLMVSLADVGVLTGLTPYLDAAQRMWLDAVSKKMYVTGGVGSTGNEGFGEPYALPNISAYAETCAVLMFMTLNHRLFLATGDSRYIDVMERGMYNNAIDGVSVSGNRFFYVNRLASAGDGRDLRWDRASLECCPPNLVRFLAGMPGFIYAQAKDAAVYVNLYASSEASFAVGGKDLALSVESEMPWAGKSTIHVGATQPVQAAIKLRVPGWARNQPAPGGLYRYVNVVNQPATMAVNGKSVAAVPDRFGYVTLERSWTPGDTIDVVFPVETRQVVADDRVRAAKGRVAIERGPMVYCVEWPDLAGGRALDVLLASPDKTTPATPTTPTTLTTTTTGVPAPLGDGVALATEARSLSRPSLPAKPLTLVPYHLWANRGAGEMSVWQSRSEFAPGDIGPAGGFIFYVNPRAEADGWRYLEAAPVDLSAGAKWGCFRQVIPGAKGTAVGTGKQNTLDILAVCTDRETAADLCANYRVNGVGGWFLPSRDELALMYRNLKAAGSGDFRTDGVSDNFSYWASTEDTADMAAHIDFADSGRQHSDDKDFPRRVRAIRAF